MSQKSEGFDGNIERFSGFSDLYNRYRPAPPEILGRLLMDLAKTSRPRLVVDLGSGTGLSTRYWADLAEQVIGIEPSEDMRQQAQRQTKAENVAYREAFSHRSSLPEKCAQIVTCSQSLHWMEPQATFEEAARILVSGGVFAAYDYDWPPTTGRWEADAAYEACIRQVRSFGKGFRSQSPVKRWDKQGHLGRMQQSGCFRYTKEIVLHHFEQGNDERLVGLLLSQGEVMTLLKAGYREDQLGIEEFRRIARDTLSNTLQPWYWSSRLRFGIV